MGRNNKNDDRKARKQESADQQLLALAKLIEMNTKNLATLSLEVHKLTLTMKRALPNLNATLSPLKSFALDTAESLVARAEFMLSTLEPMSNKHPRNMDPLDEIRGNLGLQDIDVRALTDDMSVYISERNPSASLKKTEVEKAKTIRGEVKLLQKKIEGAEPGDEDTDSAIDTAKASFP